MDIAEREMLWAALRTRERQLEDANEQLAEARKLLDQTLYLVTTQRDELDELAQRLREKVVALRTEQQDATE